MRGLFAKIASRTRQVPGHEEESSSQAVGRAGVVGRGGGHYLQLPVLLTESHAFPVSRYLSEEEVLDTENPFVQLLSGVVWLIRNGSIYINESQAAECDETQETGGGGAVSMMRCG